MFPRSCDADENRTHIAKIKGTGVVITIRLTITVTLLWVFRCHVISHNSALQIPKQREASNIPVKCKKVKTYFRQQKSKRMTLGQTGNTALFVVRDLATWKICKWRCTIYKL